MIKLFSSGCQQHDNDCAQPQELWRHQSRPSNKAICMMRLSVQSTNVLIDSETANYESLVSAVTSPIGNSQRPCHHCIPSQEWPHGFESSSGSISASVLYNTILTSRTNDPFELIPIVMEAAKAFGVKHEDKQMIKSMAITCTDNLRDILLDDGDVRSFFKERHMQSSKGVRKHNHF